MIKSKYNLYLESDKWKQMRRKILERDGYKCRICGANYNLHVHHLTYKRLYNENEEDLITVCESCHKAYHELDRMSELISEKDEAEEQASAEQLHDYWERRIQERRELERQNQEAAERIIWKRFVEIYDSRDYASGGKFDLCDWAVLNGMREEITKDIDPAFRWCVNNQALRNYVVFRRCEKLMEYMSKGLTANDIEEATLLGKSFIKKWYRRDKLDAKIAEGREIFKHITDINKEEVLKSFFDSFDELKNEIDF